MTIKTDSWHYRWYLYWLDHGRGNKPGYKENLCHYMRVLVFWAPLTWLFGNAGLRTIGKWLLNIYLVVWLAGMAAGLVYLAIYAPMTLFWVGVGMGSVVLAAILIGAVWVFLEDRFAGKRIEVPGTLKLAAGYVMAKKRRICPFLDFEAPR